MKALYLSQYYPPEACAPAARVDGFTREWARAGAEVTVLTGFPNHPEGIVQPEYRRAWRRGLLRENRGGVKVCRTWLYPSANQKLWGRGANFCSFALSAAVAGLGVAPRRGVIIATSPQILVGISGWAVGAARFLPWVFEVRDLWPESLVGVGQAGEDSFLYRAVGVAARLLYRHANHIVVDGEWKRRRLIEQGVAAGRISVIRNGVEDNFCLDPHSAGAQQSRAQVRKALGLVDEFVLLYAGTLGMAHGLETVLQAAERLRGHRDIAFLLMGAGAERAQLEQSIEQLGLTRVRLLAKQPREKIPAYLAAADACLVPLRKQHVFQTAIPSKMFEAMAAARPVILGVEGEAKQILLGSQAGLAVPPEDPEAMAAAILRLRNEPGLRLALGRNGRQAVLEKHLRRTEAARYLGLLVELCARQRVLTACAPEPLAE
jgi:colanic acid biosynthesis glycosyl transferase WcaI